MPIHDWSRVDAGIFHDFHQAWTIEICDALNAGALPSGYFALAEQVVGGSVPDVVTLQFSPKAGDTFLPSGGIAVADAPPRARFVASAEINVYAAKASRVTIRHRLGKVVAVVEIVSPGNKSSIYAIRAFSEKAHDLIDQGINLLVIDLFAPSVRDPQGIHKVIWDTIQDDPFELPPDKKLTVASYSADEPRTAYVEPVAVGDSLPSLPIFLDARTYVPAPLEATYQRTWDRRPTIVRDMVGGK